MKSLATLAISIFIALSMQSRALAGDGHGASVLDKKVEAVTAARGVMDDFMETFNARDAEAWAATFNYPHIRFASNAVHISQSANDITSTMDFEKFSAFTGWDHSAWDKIELMQAGPDKVHFAVSFTRYKENGEKIQTYESLYILTLVEGHWGIQSRSSFAP